MDWSDVFRVGAAILTGGASEIANTVINATASNQPAQQPGMAGGAAGCPPGAAPHVPPPAQAQSCCRRYQLDPPFLVDTVGGRVWRYDEKKDRFLIVDREASDIEKSWQRLLTGKLTADAVDALNQATESTSRATLTRVGGLIDDHIRVMDKYLEELKR